MEQVYDRVKNPELYLRWDKGEHTMYTIYAPWALRHGYRHAYLYCLIRDWVFLQDNRTRIRLWNYINAQYL